MLAADKINKLFWQFSWKMWKLHRALRQKHSSFSYNPGRTIMILSTFPQIGESLLCVSLFLVKLSRGWKEKMPLKEVGPREQLKIIEAETHEIYLMDNEELGQNHKTQAATHEYAWKRVRSFLFSVSGRTKTFNISPGVRGG